VTTFVDTSALLAVLDASDGNHPRARSAWEDLLARDEPMVSTNYILVETFALAQHRLGLPAVRALQEDVIPLLRIVWIDGESHARSVAALLTAGRRQLSLVDCASFETMRQLGLSAAFAFDRHFAELGFACVP
jgi:predicted nucleic acid-binding protein